MELFNILESSLIRMLSLILRFNHKVGYQAHLVTPKNAKNGKKNENQNACILSFTSWKGADDAPNYQVQFSLQSGR